MQISHAPALTLFALSVATSIPAVRAQDYPARPIRMVVPTAASGTQDVNARILAKLLTGQLGQQVIVDNRGGANGIIGADIIAKAAPDGYSLMYTGAAFLVNQSIYKSVPYDVTRDFAAVTNVAVSAGNLLLINPAVPAHSVKEFIELSKNTQLSYGSAGIGNPTHLICEAFNVRAGTRMLHVPYKGTGPALTALFANEVQVIFIPPSVAIAHVKAGRLRALGFTGAKRPKSMPEVPTIAESGLPGFQMDAGWHAIFAPAKTPAAIIDKLHAEIRTALQVPNLRDFLIAADYEPAGDPPAQFQKIFSADIRRWAEVVRLAGIKPE
jgi:tripartite-type tricarboxylate transporter receptor subunit TctC